MEITLRLVIFSGKRWGGEEWIDIWNVRLTQCGLLISYGVIDLFRLYITCCLATPRHHLNQCRLSVNKSQMNSYQCNFSKMLLMIMMCKIYIEIVSLICRLFSTKSLPQPALPYRQLEPNGHIAMTFHLLVWRFYSRILFAKCRSFGPGLNEMNTPPTNSLRTVMAAADTTLTVQWFQQVAVRKPLYKKQSNTFCFRGHVSYC